MKRGTPNHPKTLMLASCIEAIYAKHHAKKKMCSPRAMAIGILEVLWEWCSKYAIQGDIGKWPDAVISQAVEWEFSPNELISSLIESRWLETAPKPWRLVLHDIKDHATNTWRQNLEDAGLTWWDGSSPRKYKLRKSPENLQNNSRISPQPEAEAEPEEEKTPPTPSVPVNQPSGGKTLCIDDRFSEFRTLAEKYGMSGSEPDWHEAHVFTWRLMDFEARIAAVQGIRERIKAGATDDPAQKALPANYLKRKMWQRKIRAPDASSRTDATNAALDRVILREAEKHGLDIESRRAIGAITAGDA